MKKFRKLAGVMIAASALALTGCGSADNNQASDQGGEKTELTVFAAASLNKAFSDIAAEFEQDNPNVSVNFSFEGSSTLVDQMAEGAPADVFASADEKNMTRASQEELVGESQEFATNVLTLIVPAGNPAKITGLDDSLDDARLVVCAPGVPCGNATETLADNLGIELNPVSEEQKVTDVRGKVEAGEADAGLVYTTDAKAAGDAVEVIEVPGADEVVNRYPIAVTKTGADNAAAQAFVTWVLSERGQEILASYGFGPGADAN
ncbi:MAG: molybdate ABC transporter substrate-binding protein [Bowdeniella nasicola]|nr:molybdate ABC transporter substrate-binding protein [Bowdeniella nasicola]